MYPNVASPIKYSHGQIYGLFQITDTNPILIRNLTDIESKSIIEGKFYISQFQACNGRILEVEMNLNEFLNAAHQDYEPLITPIERLDNGKNRKLILDLNRLCKNYIWSWRACIDLMDKLVKNTYSEKSDQYKSFKEKTGTLFDDYFEYRFIYKLRNVGSHIDDIIKLLKVETNKRIPLFSRESLINSKEFSNKHFKEDFEKLDYNFKAGPILEQSFVQLLNLFLECMHINKELFLAHSKNILTIMQPYGDIYLSFAEYQTNEYFSLQEVPIRIAHNVIKHYSEPINLSL